VRKGAYTADNNGGAFAHNVWHSVYTRALRAQLNVGPWAFASEMPCAPAVRWLAHSVRAGRPDAHVDTTTAFYHGKATCYRWSLLTISVLATLKQRVRK